MQTFSKRNNLVREYSGYENATIQLRNRLLQLYGEPYSGDEYHFGIGNYNWIHERAFDKDLQMFFGRKVSIENLRQEIYTNYNEVFDFIELYYNRAKKDLDSIKRSKLLADISNAFINSGSVYEFNIDGQVVLKIEEDTANKITKVDSILDPFANAQSLYRDCVDGLITRTKQPKDVVKDMAIVLEEFSKKITNRDNFEKAKRYLKDFLKLHSTQLQIVDKLIAYRGDVWGVAHAGNSPKPNEQDALWYLETVVTQINYLNNKSKQFAAKDGIIEYRDH